MTAGLRSAATLVGLALLVLVAALWGWSAATKPLPKEEPLPVCVETEIAAGEWVYRDQVVVSVFNGSGRSGLAAATLSGLTERGFAAGETGNAPQQTGTTQIWATDPENPAVALVRAQFKGAKIVPGEALGPGVVVVVGEKFRRLRKKQVNLVEAKADSVICAVPGSTD